MPRSIGFAIAVALSAAAAVVVAGEPAVAVPDQDAGQWTVTDVPVRSGNLLAVDLAPDDDERVVATGFRITKSFRFAPLALVRTGETWERQRVRGEGNDDRVRLNDVALRSSSRGWAVGDSTTDAGSGAYVARWNGARWRSSVLDEPGMLSLLGVETVGREVWAVGQDQVGSALEPLIMHRDGTSWSRAEVPPLEDVGDFLALTGVAAAARDDVWAVGTGGLALHYDGDEWSQVPVPKVNGNDVALARVRILAPDDLWAVGHTTRDSGDRRPVALHWVDDAWKVIDTPAGDIAQLNDVTRTSGGSTVAFGSAEGGALSFYGLRLSPDGPARPLSLPPGKDALYGTVASPTARDLWVVGVGAVDSEGFIAPYAAVRR